MTLRYTDIVQNLWLFRNPSNPQECKAVRPFSVRLIDGYADWNDLG